MQVVLNELSFPKTNTVEDAKEAFDDFFNFCIALHKLSLNISTNIIKVDFENFKNQEITKDYTFCHWLKTISHKQQQAKSLFIKMLAENKPAVNYPEVTYQKDECKGLSYAAQNDLMAISFFSQKWSKKRIELKELSLTEKELKEISKSVFVKHSSQKKHLISYEIWLELSPLFYNEKPKIFQDGKGKADKDKIQKNIFPKSSVTKELVENVEIVSGFICLDWDDFYSKINANSDNIVSLSTEEKISIAKKIAKNVVNINGWNKSISLSTKNRRDVYNAGYGKETMYLSLDTQHKTFELHNYNGEHKGEFFFSGKFNKHSTHKLKV
jgi:hypothetical protein